MIIYNIPQGSEEWFKVRAGKLTGSNAQQIGNCGKGLDTLCFETVAEKYLIKPVEGYENEHTKRGHELEPFARGEYERVTSNPVTLVGFVEYNDYVGTSPDGLVSDDGLIEIKCPDTVKYFEHLVYGIGAIDSKYMWQMQMNLLVTGRKWCDYVAYNPNFQISMWVQRIYPDKDMQQKLLEGFAIGENKIKELINKYDSKNNILHMGE